MVEQVLTVIFLNNNWKEILWTTGSWILCFGCSHIDDKMFVLSSLKMLYLLMQGFNRMISFSVSVGAIDCECFCKEKWMKQEMWH